MCSVALCVLTRLSGALCTEPSAWGPKAPHPTSPFCADGRPSWQLNSASWLLRCPPQRVTAGTSCAASSGWEILTQHCHQM